METNNNIELQFCSYDDDANCTYTNFKVSLDWLINNINVPVKYFLNNYTSEESIPLYEKAILENVILEKEIIK